MIRVSTPAAEARRLFTQDAIKSSSLCAGMMTAKCNGAETAECAEVRLGKSEASVRTSEFRNQR